MKEYCLEGIKVWFSENTLIDQVMKNNAYQLGELRETATFMLPTRREIFLKSAVRVKRSFMSFWFLYRDGKLE